jgi:hypothetical protein
VIQALNYCTHAIENLSLEQFPAKEVADNIRPPFNKHTLAVLRRSEKFIIPAGGELLDISKKIRPQYMDLVHLPYDAVALEVPTPPNAEDSRAPNFCDATIFLLFYAGAQQLPRPDAGSSSVDPRTIIIRKIRHFRSLKLWDLLPAEAHVRPDLLDEGEDFCRFATFCPTRQDVAVKELLDWGVDMLFQFCFTVNCQNVRREVHLPSIALSKKRHKAGKVPLYSHWTLVLNGDGDAKGRELGGSHASPRLHLRRGHLRRLDTGPVIWVRHCMVGNPDRGVVEKDYAMKEVHA